MGEPKPYAFTVDLGSYGGPREWAVSYERGTPVCELVCAVELGPDLGRVQCVAVCCGVYSAF